MADEASARLSMELFGEGMINDGSNNPLPYADEGVLGDFECRCFTLFGGVFTGVVCGVCEEARVKRLGSGVALSSNSYSLSSSEVRSDAEWTLAEDSDAYSAVPQESPRPVGWLRDEGVLPVREREEGDIVKRAAFQVGSILRSEF
jgi:hypothetical protein